MTANADLGALIARLERQVKGRLCVAMHDFQNAIWFLHRGHEVVATASTYKLLLLLEITCLVDAGSVGWEMPLVLTESLQARGSGVLKHLSPGLCLCLRDLCFLMTVISDNSATDVLIDHFGIEGVNARMEKLGLSNTRLVLQPPQANAFGRSPLAAGFTTASEMAQLLCMLEQGALGAGVKATVLEVLGAQQDRSMIARKLPAFWQYAGKTGCNEDLRADAGLVTGSDGKRYALAVYCGHPSSNDWSVDAPGVLAVAELAGALLQQ